MSQLYFDMRRRFTYGTWEWKGQELPFGTGLCQAGIPAAGRLVVAAELPGP